MMSFSDVYLYAMLPFITSFAAQKVIIAFSQKGCFFIDKNCGGKIQSFHKMPTPRAGGIGILLANILLIQTEFGLFFLIISSIAFLGGIIEDFFGKLLPRDRIIFQCLAAFAGIFFLGALADKIGFGIHLPILVAYIYTIFAIVGGTNSINIIDGFNGLASGFSLIVIGILAYLSWQTGEIEIFKILMVNIFAIFGFFVLNFPKGEIFLGDGGAYFLGFLITETSILLFQRHEIISPWFFLLIMIYPVWEVLFSIYRRKILKKSNATQPDKMHLHQIFYRRLTKSNPLASVITVSHIVPFLIAGLMVMKNEHLLMIICFMYCASYIFFYNILIRKKMPYIFILAQNILAFNHLNRQTEKIKKNKKVEKKIPVLIGNKIIYKNH